MLKPGGWIVVKEHVHKALGMHIVHLEHVETGAQHKLQIMIGHDACPTCGHVTAKDNLGEIDPHAEKHAQIKTLNEADAQMEAWARKHRTKVLRK